MRSERQHDTFLSDRPRLAPSQHSRKPGVSRAVLYWTLVLLVAWSSMLLVAVLL